MKELKTITKIKENEIINNISNSLGENRKNIKIIGSATGGTLLFYMLLKKANLKVVCDKFKSIKDIKNPFIENDDK